MSFSFPLCGMESNESQQSDKSKAEENSGGFLGNVDALKGTAIED